MGKIKKSVGKGCKNEKADVEEVQKLLNVFVKDCGFAKLKIDGDCGRKTNGAIETFQSMSSKEKATGKIEPNSRTMKALQQPTPTKHVIKALAALKEAEEALKKAKVQGNIISEYLKKGITDPALIPHGKPNVVGNTTGVDKKLVTALSEISAHFGEKIRVTSGYRTPKEQGKTMFKYWTINLERGMIYGVLKNDPVKRKKLDDHFNAGEEAAFVKIVEPDAKSYSRHVRGTAIDIGKETNTKMVKAMETVCRVLTEKTCYHLDDKGKSFPTKITDDLRRKWKR